MFSLVFSSAKVYLSPRGELSESALLIRAHKKRAYLFLFRRLEIYKRIIWVASAEKERAEILRLFDADSVNVHVLRNFPDNELPKLKLVRQASVGSLDLVWLARISPMKNICFLIHVFRHVSVDVSLTIYGPIEDESYWAEFVQLKEQLPANVSIIYEGMLQPEQVASTLADYDAYILPTKGENYGHTIVEAMSVGLPVIISDKTPWRSLEDKGIGFDLSLDDPEKFSAAIHKLAMLNVDQRNGMRRMVYDFVKNEIGGDSNRDYAAGLFG